MASTPRTSRERARLEITYSEPGNAVALFPGMSATSRRVLDSMKPITRRTLLAAPIATAGALMLARHAGTQPAGPEFGPDSPYLTARESPTYDTSFAVFSTQLSVVAGDELQIRVRTDGAVDVEICRVGWTGGRSLGVTMTRLDDVKPGRVQDDAAPASWPAALRLAVPAEWKSGLYVAVVVDRADRRRRRLAPFVVRSASPSAGIVVNVPFTTYHAYNGWGGASMYDFNSPNGVATELPIQRPFDVFDGAGFLFYGDWQLAQWLDREQYDVSYITSYDLHDDQRSIDGANVFVTAFHDEYWSTPMRGHLERFIERGGNAMFLTANSIYWRVRLDDTTMTCHKATSESDDPHPDITATWRSDLIGEPENLILGSQYHDYEFPYGTGFDWTVATDDHWLYEGTGLRNGATLPGLIGYEWDRAPNRTPDGTTVLAHSDFTKANGEPRSHDATERVHAGGGTVVNVGTTYWPRFLIADDLFRADPSVEQMTHNMLRKLGGDRGR